MNFIFKKGQYFGTSQNGINDKQTNDGGSNKIVVEHPTSTLKNLKCQ